MDRIHRSWNKLFEQYEINLDYLYQHQHQYQYQIYPPIDDVFNIFQLDVKLINIVLLGQDPYHKFGQAHGLSFSVKNDQRIPPSLKNIFKQLKLEFANRNYEFTHGNLDNWLIREHIFLLNSALTVIENKPGSHLKTWITFTDDVIKYIADNNEKCVFLLLGNYAKDKDKYINDKSRIIYGVHPSPLARGFVGSNVFTEIEQKLNSQINRYQRLWQRLVW